MNGQDAVLAIHKNIESLRTDVTRVMTEGCAKREGDVKQVTNLEHSLQVLGSKMDKIFYATLVTAGGIIAFLLKAFLPLLIK